VNHKYFQKKKLKSTLIGIRIFVGKNIRIGFFGGSKQQQYFLLKRRFNLFF